jgi:hypothetical protein
VYICARGVNEGVLEARGEEMCGALKALKRWNIRSESSDKQ